MYNNHRYVQYLWLFFSTVIVMTLFLKRDVSADNQCFIVYDALGAEQYRVIKPTEGILTKYKFVVTDLNGVAAAKIRRLPFVGTSTYVLRFGNKHVTLLTVPTAKGIYSYFYGSNWHIVGELAAKNFSIIDVDKTLILEHRLCADYCELTIPDSANVLFCIATSVCANLINTIDSPALQAI